MLSPIPIVHILFCGLTNSPPGQAFRSEIQNLFNIWNQCYFNRISDKKNVIVIYTLSYAILSQMQHASAACKCCI